MALFPRSLYSSDSSFHPLFQLLDDYDTYSRRDQNTRNTGMIHWQPRFDICETPRAYELHGELPGMNKKEVHIEFTEPQTLVIRGKSQRTYTSGNPPAGFVEGPSMHGAIKGDGDEHNKSQPQQPEKGDKHDDKTKYWLAERSVGEFSRTFTFPSHVDQDSVSASFQDGILSIIVPKVKKHESRRIQIN
ncbi:probable heat shock protein 30 [Fusarium fujikuroi]|uniref:Uncharacterized protein n=1 Tax=Fusarium fujikuroi TaxID=5127 RepID=A0A2H3RG49_FUSFU|nr:Uncharacterized protein Y057_8055 [Fusarium fujikuroi]SCN65723.1 probable heat shock protein 30 [Fusarium fujikuroi]SCN68683.1 probable heat shock protein 30 [Fusarium fujikuroi]SCO18711.1 probable heat shock protein 30 [Fusarium fujikuroi]SCO27943.1 probable heat shock protein 30 [Fusarium fujikuroi]